MMATQGPLGSWPPPTWEGLGDLLVPGILPANQGLLPSSAALGQHQAHHSPARLALGTRLPPVYRQPPPPSQSHSRPWSGGGMTDGGGAILTRVCSSGGRGGGTLGLVGAGTLHCCHLQGPWGPIPLPQPLSQARGTQAWGALTQQPCHLGHPDSHGLGGCALGLQGWEGPPGGQSLKAPW